EALTEGRAEHELQLELDSTPEFAYRDHWREGDIVPLRPIPDVELTATISEAELTISDGVRVRPVVGAGDDPVLSALTPLISSIRAMARSTRLMANRGFRGACETKWLSLLIVILVLKALLARPSGRSCPPRGPGSRSSARMTWP